MSGHIRYMKTALMLAQRNLGQTWPNPSVGALLVKNDQIIATGATARGGRPHAETEALAAAGKHARGATLYVTLEPCSHQGKTGPCAQAIIDAGIKTCVIATADPNPQVNGAGLAMLNRAGIEVIENICKAEACELNRGFFSVIEKKRPYVALKIATSIDGKITHPGQRWITGEPARAHVHCLRSHFDAIATGSGTVAADDPELTCRLPGLENRSPQRIVFTRSSLSEQTKLAHAKNIWLTDKPIAEALAELAEKGVTRLFVEAGQRLTSAFLTSGLADRLYWYRSPISIGSEGLAAFTPETRLPPLHSEGTQNFGNDTLETYRLN